MPALPEWPGASARAWREGAGLTAGELLRLAREEAGLSQTQLAARAQTKQSAISRLECGIVSPTVETLARLIEATGVGTLEVGIRRARSAVSAHSVEAL